MILKRLIRNYWYIPVVIVILIAGFIYYRQSTEVKVRGEKSYRVKNGLIKETLSLSGLIDAEEKATLRFQSSGLMTWVGVKEGDIVKKYQGIASLDQRELQMNLKKYLNTYMKYRWDFDQSKDENDIKYIGGLSEEARRESLRVLDKAQFDLNNSVLDVELKNLAMQFSYLYTPIEGMVTKVNSAYAGVYITPSQAEFEVVNPSTIYFSATADQTDVVRLKKEMTGTVILDAYPENDFKGAISSIAFTPKTGETGTVYEVKAKLNTDNKDYRYRLGMTGDIEFPVSGGRRAIIIPNSYIKTQGTEKYVIKSEKGKKVKTIIKLGEVIDSTTEVTSGLTTGDIIYD